MRSPVEVVKTGRYALTTWSDWQQGQSIAEMMFDHEIDRDEIENGALKGFQKAEYSREGSEALGPCMGLNCPCYQPSNNPPSAKSQMKYT